MTDDRDDLDTTEERLRAAIAARTAAVNPTDQVARQAEVEARLGHRRVVSRRRVIVLAAAAVAILALIAGAVVLTSDPADQDIQTVGPDESSTTVPSSSTTTSSIPSTTTTTPLPTPTADPRSIWPFADSGVRYDNATDAAVSFAQDYLGMPDAQAVGGDGKTSIDIRPFGGCCPVTHVATIDDPALGWAVVGAQSDDIIVQGPADGADLTSPLEVSGRSIAFEAQIRLELRPFGSLHPAGEGTTAMGGGTEILPFSATVPVPAGLTRAVLVVYEPDASDRAVMVAAAVVPLGIGIRGPHG